MVQLRVQFILVSLASLLAGAPAARGATRGHIAPFGCKVAYVEVMPNISDGRNPIGEVLLLHGAR